MKDGDGEGDSCINFTPTQYISIYHMRLQDDLIRDSDRLNVMCLLQMRPRGWQNKNTDVNCSS